jgi:alpha-beta hydrolase superfamily lysophospholipase
LISALGLLGTAWWLGEQYHAPRQYAIGPPPADLNAQTVTFANTSGTLLKGWLLPAAGSAGVVLLHGRGGDRRSMLSRARFLQQAGFWALVFDFQANGESPGKHYTGGYLESEDARAAVRYLRSKAQVGHIGIVGFSLGGAAALLGPHGPLTVDAMVLEAVYPSIEEAVANRLRLYFGSLAGWLSPLFTWQLRPRLGISPKELSPIERITEIQCPVLIIAGEHDRRATAEESLRLFRAAPAPKRLWIVPNAKHENFYLRAPSEYQLRVLEFFRENLGFFAGEGEMKP